jgi:hypothetical protein
MIDRAELGVPCIATAKNTSSVATPSLSVSRYFLFFFFRIPACLGYFRHDRNVAADSESLKILELTFVPKVVEDFLAMDVKSVENS